MALVVVGGVAAGLSAAARARRIDPRLEIIVLEKGPVISYGACGLPYFLEGRVHAARQLIVYTPEYFRKERNIDVRTGARVLPIWLPHPDVAPHPPAPPLHQPLPTPADAPACMAVWRCRQVVVAPGVKPTGALAGAACVEVGRTGAIRTADRMETNRCGVFAAGDCSEGTQPVSGRPTWIPLGTTPNKM